MANGAAIFPAPSEQLAELTTRARVLEFLLVGGGTLLVLPALWLTRRVMGWDSAELAVGFLMFHAAHVINDPHFSVTYWLFYKDARTRAFGDAFVRQQRLRYLVAGFVVPALLSIWIGLSFALDSARGLGWLVQLMFLLVGWHYVKQGFGVVTVLSARRGVRYTTSERHALLAHCFAAWAYAWANPAAPLTEAEEKGVIYWSLAHPLWLERVALSALIASGVLLGFRLARKWRRERQLPPLGPLVSFLVTVWLWTIFSSWDPLLLYVIPALHSLQYLYFVALLRRNQARASLHEFGPSPRRQLLLLALAALALGWFQFHGVPDLLDAVRMTEHRRGHHPLGAFGPTPFLAACFAFVNIHHYFMDNVIWRRENPEMRALQP